MKKNDKPQYVHAKSDHPPQILKNVPPSVNKRLSTISSSKEEFDAAASTYQEALRKAGHDYTLEYDEEAGSNNNNNNRRRQNKTKTKQKQNKTKQNKTKQNKTKQNKKTKTKQNKTKQNKTKQNKTKTKQNKK